MHAKINPKPCGKRLRAKLIALWPVPTWMLLTACSITILSGCKTAVVAIPADKTVVSMPAGQPFTPTNGPGYFVPAARMLEILTELERKP